MQRIDYHQPSKAEKEKAIDRYRYSPSDAIGRGAFSVVYTGRHSETAEKVAIKVIDKLSFAGAYCLTNLQSEVDIMRKLKHPNIVQLLDIYQTHRNVYLVTELCEEDLRQWLGSRGVATEEEAIAILRDIMGGYQYLHDHGILHRDLKPANLLIKGGTCKLADFGFARNLESGAQTVLRSVVGTPLYMSPQLLSHMPYTAKSDLWSVGLIFYQLLHGVTPWTAQNQMELLRNILQQPIHFSQKVSNKSRSFIEGCLKIDEDKRMNWEEAFRHPVLGVSSIIRLQSPGRQRRAVRQERSNGKENVRPIWENREKQARQDKPTKDLTQVKDTTPKALKGNAIVVGGPMVSPRPTSRSIKEVRVSRIGSESKLIRGLAERRTDRTPSKIPGASSRDIRIL